MDRNRRARRRPRGVESASRDQAATPAQEERTALLEMFFTSYKGQAGIIFHNPYNEYS